MLLLHQPRREHSQITPTIRGQCRIMDWMRMASIAYREVRIVASSAITPLILGKTNRQILQILSNEVPLIWIRIRLGTCCSNCRRHRLNYPHTTATRRTLSTMMCRCRCWAMQLRPSANLRCRRWVSVIWPEGTTPVSHEIVLSVHRNGKRTEPFHFFFIESTNSYLFVHFTYCKAKKKLTKIRH